MCALPSSCSVGADGGVRRGVRDDFLPSRKDSAPPNKLKSGNSKIRRAIFGPIIVLTNRLRACRDRHDGRGE